MPDQLPDDVLFEIVGPIVVDRNSGWASVVVPGSAALLGTGQSVTVGGTIDGHQFEATMLPIGNGEHMIPVKAAVRKAIGKGLGDEVTLVVDRKTSASVDDGSIDEFLGASVEGPVLDEFQVEVGRALQDGGALLTPVAAPVATVGAVAVKLEKMSKV